MARVVRIHGNGSIPQHGLRPRGRHGNSSRIITHKRIGNVPEMTVLFLMGHFKIGERGRAAGAPVSDALAPINQALVVQPHERSAHGARRTRIERERVPRPVAGSA